jgi:hypothetical protein
LIKLYKERSYGALGRGRKEKLVGINKRDPVRVSTMGTHNLSVRGKLGRFARDVGEKDVVHYARIRQRGQYSARPVVAGVVSYEEAVYSDNAMESDPFEDIGRLILKDRSDAKL